MTASGRLTPVGTAGPPWEDPAWHEPPWAAEPGKQRPTAEWSGAGLSARLTALARLIQIASARRGSGGFSDAVIQDAEDLMNRAGERLRLSADHTIVALAGGTGSGKSSLFNQLAGADFSPAGVTRPVTRDPHACVWGTAGSGPLLEWLEVPRRHRYARESPLDSGEASLNGLILLDLPDHDSVASGGSRQVDRLIGMADLMVWVLDPQKYADAALHKRYLVPLAGHSDVIAVVLNQSDLLSADEVGECAGDLRRLLDSEGLHDAAVLVTSAAAGSGIDELRTLLARTVSERRATTARISADLDGLVAEFAPCAEPSELAVAPGLSAARPDGSAATGDPGEPGRGLPAENANQLADAFARAAGVPAVAESLCTARELRAVDFVGWPVAWAAGRLTGRDPLRKIRLGRLWDELENVSAGPSGAQQADIDTALTKLADQIGGGLPKPWSQSTRAAVRSRAGDIPAAIGTAISESLPAEKAVPGWWRLIGSLQGLLLGCVIVGLAWLVSLLVFGVFHAARNVPRLFADAWLLPWVVLMIAAFLFLGWLTASGCLALVRAAAARERARVQEIMHARMEVIARDMVLIPAEQELSEYRRFSDELRVAAGA